MNTNKLVVYMRADVTGEGWMTLCIKIGYSGREPRRVILPCIKVEYVSAMYSDMEPRPKADSMS